MIPKISINPVFLWLLIISGLAATSCEREAILDDPGTKVVFSSDTVMFDTIFTSIGSVTRHFKVFNPFDPDLKIESIYLGGGEDSKYRINVNGIPGKSFNDILLRGGDSLFIFVETTIDPLDENSPIVIEDSIVFSTNGNIQDVKLISWGQDVNIIRGEIFKTGILTADKPYLVYDHMIVDTGQVLSLEPGARLHFHRNAGLHVAGTIIAEGTLENPVVFEGARTETAYRDIPGQWEGIWLMPGSTNNRFVNTRIKNAVNGILADSLTGSDSNKLYLANSRIENMTYAGLIGLASDIYSYNTIIAACGHYAVMLDQGGNYIFYHCTIANYWNFSSRNTPSVLINNRDGSESGNSGHLNVFFGNSIIHGSRSSEIGMISYPENDSNEFFSHCLVKIDSQIFSSYPWLFNNCFKGEMTGFVDIEESKFGLGDESPAIDAGEPEIGNIHPLDFDGKSRVSDDAPDIGAYEWLEVEDDDT